MGTMKTTMYTETVQNNLLINGENYGSFHEGSLNLFKTSNTVAAGYKCIGKWKNNKTNMYLMNHHCKH